MNSVVFEMQPAKIQVSVVTVNLLPEIKRLLDNEPSFFPSFNPAKMGNKAVLTENSVVIEGAYDNFFSERPAPTTFAEVGDYYLISDNGFRCFSKDARLKHGVFLSIPEELLIPRFGNKLSAEEANKL